MEDNNDSMTKEIENNKNTIEIFSLKSHSNSLGNTSSTLNNIILKENPSKEVDYVSSDSIQSKINPKTSSFPYCIVWTPIPIITYVIPTIGHTGIGTSSGIIHDFAGSFFVSVNDFAFGKPTKYYQLELTEQERKEFDRAIEKGDNKYNMQEHNLCCNNCHSHVAYILNQLKFKGKSNYTMVHIWWMMISKGKYVSFFSLIKTYMGFIIFMFVLWVFLRKN